MHDEMGFWERYWQSRIDYYLKKGHLFEDDFRWGYYCNLSIYNHYKSISRNTDFPKKILEWGAGSGYVSCLAALENNHVTVLDYSEKSIQYINIVAKVLEVDRNINIVHGELDNISKSEKFDVVWNCGVLEHYDDKEIIAKIKTISGLLRPGGIIINTLPNLGSPEGIFRRFQNLLRNESRSERTLSFEKWIFLHKAAGIRNIRIVPVNHYVPSFIPGKLAYEIARQFPLSEKDYKKAWLFSVTGNV